MVEDVRKTGMHTSSLAPPSVLWESLELLEPRITWMEPLEESTADMTPEVGSLPIGGRVHMWLGKAKGPLQECHRGAPGFNQAKLAIAMLVGHTPGRSYHGVVAAKI